MAVSRPQDPHRNFQFDVSLDGGATFGAAFMKVSGLSMETTVIEHRDGADIATPRKLPGLSKFGDITLERGHLLDTQIRDWARLVFDRRLGIAQSEDFRKTLVIRARSRSGAVVSTWRVFYAWPTTVEYGDLDGNDESVLVERIVVAHEGWELLEGAGDAEPA